METDKAVVEIAALADGTLGGVTAQPGDVIPVGHTIAWILATGESVPPNAIDGDGSSASSQKSKEAGSNDFTGAATPASALASATAPTLTPSTPHAASSAGNIGGVRSPRISPKARRLAKENNVNIEQLHGSGADGEILAADILAAAAGKSGAPTSAPAATTNGTEEKLSAIGRLMAERTAQSWTTVPHFFVTREVDATALLKTREESVAKIEKSRGVRPTITDLLVSLVAQTLVKHPRVNATWTGQTIRTNPEINIALAMAVDDGVVTAVIRKADSIAIADIAMQRRDLTERARSNRLRPEDIAGATFTISNLGMHHVDSFTAIIVPPQAAILAVSAIKDRVVAVDGNPVVKPMLTLTLSSDHRVIDGARAAAFLDDLVGALLHLKNG